jgi:Sigma-70 region 2
VSRQRDPLAVTGQAGPGGCDDTAIVGQSVGEPERFAVLFDRHSAGIYRYLAQRVGPDLADDLVAETFLRAFAARERYDTSRPDARPWLFGIATNPLPATVKPVGAGRSRSVSEQGGEPDHDR